MRLKRGPDEEMESGYLDGPFLVAMPGMADDRFARSVIYICAHSAEGAMGIVLNRPASDLTLPDLLVQLDIVPESERIRLPRKVGHLMVLMGGPVETSRGFVLHSPDFYIDQSTLPIDDSPVGILRRASSNRVDPIASRAKARRRRRGVQDDARNPQGGGDVART